MRSGDGRGAGRGGESAITGYDAQYVALAQNLNATLITEDRKLRNAVSGIAVSMQEFLVQ